MLFRSSLQELRQLAKTLGYETVGTFTQKRTRFDPAAYFGVGKREEIRRFAWGEPEDAAAVDDEEGAPDEAELPEPDPALQRADLILVDHEITPSQARILEKATGLEVMDRTMVILEIFRRHARSRAARAQVEIARLNYMAPRLREQAKMAGIGRQRSGVGGRGAGVKVLDLDRQKVRNRVMELQREIDAMDGERRTQRARRQERQGIARVALVGYTNAGKSTLMRALKIGRAHV